MTGIQQTMRFFGAIFVIMLLLAPAAKPDTLDITFTGGNPGDGGTVTTDGCSVCSNSDITDFDITILGYEFTPAASSVDVSGSPGALLGNDSINFFNIADFLPLLILSEGGSWSLMDPILGVEFASRGEFSVTPESGVPEPSSLILMLGALLILGFAARRRYRAAAA